MREQWEAEAQQWLRWARAPDHDAYWQCSPAFFDEIVPAPGRLTVEVGCGEGRVARDLGARGHRVVALDGSPTLVTHAATADPTGRYLVGDAHRLPLDDGVADVVVAYNTLMDVNDLPAAVGECARILANEGRLCVCVTHPTADAVTVGEDGSAVVTGRYLDRREVDAVVERAGLRMRFRGWAWPLEAYAQALEAAGLVVERLREPASPAPDPAGLAGLPLFLHIRAVKHPGATAPGGAARA